MKIVASALPKLDVFFDLELMEQNFLGVSQLVNSLAGLHRFAVRQGLRLGFAD